MDEKRPQPAWKKGGQQQQQQHGSKDHRSWNRGQRQDKRDRSWRRDGSSERKVTVGPLEVEVYNNDVDQALKVLKNRLAKDGILQELKAHRHAEKPSERKRRKHREALKRLRKSKGKRRQKGGKPNRAKMSKSRPIQESADLQG